MSAVTQLHAEEPMRRTEFVSPASNVPFVDDEALALELDLTAVKWALESLDTPHAREIISLALTPQVMGRLQRIVAEVAR